MKLTKRIIVLVAVFALFIACFAFPASAEFTEDNIEDILEYYNYPYYLSENYDSSDAGSYVCSKTDAAYASLNVTTSGAEVIKDGQNGLLRYINSDNMEYLGYSLVIDDEVTENDMIGELVFSARIRADKASANSPSSFSLALYAYGPGGTPLGEGGLITPLKLDFASGNIHYAKVSAKDSAKFVSAKIPGYTLNSDAWYNVEFIVNCENGTYNFTVTPDSGAAYESTSISLGDAEFINELIASFSSLPTNSGSVNYIDNIDFYRGTFVRHGISRDVATAKALSDIAETLLVDELDLETQIRIAKVYETIVNSDYVPINTDEFTLFEVRLLYENAVEFIPATYTRAFCEEAASIDTGRSYSRRLKQVALIESYVEIMNDEARFEELSIAAVAKMREDINKYIDDYIKELDAEAEDPDLSEEDIADIAEERALYVQMKREAGDMIDLFDLAESESFFENMYQKFEDEYDILGFVDEAKFAIEDNTSMVTELKTAKIKLADEKLLLERVKSESELFISYMKDFNPELRDLGAMQDLCNMIENNCSLRDNSYKYAELSPNVYDYDILYRELKAKLAAITANVDAFKEQVAIMSDSTKKFYEVEAAYNAASLVYNNGAIHPDVDLNTISGIESDIEFYITTREYINTVIAACDRFIASVDSAAESAEKRLYETAKDAITEAKGYLTADADLLIKDYDEADSVVAAKEKIASVEEAIAAMEAAAAEYISAVAKISEVDAKTAYSEYKSAIEAAIALSDDGNIMGIDGVAEANMSLSDHEAILDSYETNSKLLVDSVSSLKNEELTLQERYALIAAASAVSDKAHTGYSGVSDAKNKLETYKAQYLEDVQALNNAVKTATVNASVCAEASINQSRLADVVEVLKAIVLG